MLQCSMYLHGVYMYYTHNTCFMVANTLRKVQDLLCAPCLLLLPFQSLSLPPDPIPPPPPPPRACREELLSHGCRLARLGRALRLCRLP